LLRWIASKATRQRLKISCEIFATPILELGDKIKIYDHNREYYISNPSFGDRTFVITSIGYSTSEAGPKMNIALTEVG